ncbi:hypothetical protein M378DRAFT_179751 [Amanita muscaria Koide BX008]|uniref:Uncharacterized protein n=1 Tax=Amanita muscaria (strain Koide BX008) TaxID=946122 RepID=A0A0C2WL07_AMAMK|nr:hypothetical protein M378DRAFT_179751 [Amanita muscaria Koide BX008]
MVNFPSLVLLSILSFTRMALANSACVAFDISWNLLAFGFNGKDYNAGTQDTWTSGNAQDITTSGRPPFNGANTTCYLSQYTNAIYVLGADSSNPSSIYIYDATAKSWSTQSVTTGGFDPTNFDAILDHDTNVFYAYSKQDIYALDMGLLKAANSTPLPWTDVQHPDFATSDYQPVMALAQNHIHFLNVPGLSNGSARIFVIHFSYLQPAPQSYGNFPNTYGQATSFFQESGVQQEFAFIPSDGSATYVINVETNTTQTLKGPSLTDARATYFASNTALIQLSSSGNVSYLLYDPTSASANANAAWNVVSKLPVAVSASSSSSGAGSSKTSSGSGTSATGKASGSGNGASDIRVGLVTIAVATMATLLAMAIGY